MRQRIVTKKGNIAEGTFDVTNPEAKEAIESVVDAASEILKNKLNHKKEEK